jgi:hypothetical protein
VFWQRVAAYLVERGVVGKAGEFTVVRAQQFVYSLGGVRLRSVTEGIIRDWADELGRNQRLELWQLKQAVEAVRLFRRASHAPVKKQKTAWIQSGELTRSIVRVVKTKKIGAGDFFALLKRA